MAETILIVGSVAVVGVLVKAFKRIKKCSMCRCIECEQNTMATPNNNTPMEPINEIMRTVNQLNTHQMDIKQQLNKNKSDTSFS